MPTITRDRIRLELHLDRDGSLIDKLTDATPLLWRGTDTQFELAVFFDGALMDPSTLSSLRLQVKPADNRIGTALMDKTITTFNAALTQANWDNKTDQHCVVSFLNSETNFVIGADSKDYWLVVTALTTDVPARKVTLGTSTVTVVESGSTDGSTPPAGDPLFYTGAQSDARYVLKGGDTMTGLLQWSGTGHAGLKLNNLTTAQRDLLTPAAGNLIYNTTDGRPQFRDGASWTEFAKRSGDTFTGAVTVTALTIGALAGVLKATAGAVSGSATTSDLPEGTNLYYTQARFDTAFAAKTTTNLAEGTNLYYTDARARAAVGVTQPYVANGILHATSTTAIGTSGNLTWDGAILTVVGGAAPIIVRQISSTGYASIRIYNDLNSGARALELDYAGSAYTSALISGGPIGEQAAIYTSGAFPLVFGVGAVAKWQLTTSGAWQSVGAQTLQTSTGNLTVKANGSGLVSISGGDNGAGTTIATFNNGSGVAKLSLRGDGALLYFAQASEIQTSVGLLTITGNAGITLSTAANTNILMSPNGTGGVGIGAAPVSSYVMIQKDQNASTSVRVRNDDAGSSNYSMIGVNSFGNSWGMRMGSTAANSNALEFVLDAFSAPVVKMKLSTGGDLALSGDLELTAGGTISTTANGNILLSPDGTGWTKVAVGNLGVGIDPLYPLHVSGRVQIKGAGTGTGTYGIDITDSSGTDNFWVRDDGTSYIRTSLGIGESPTAKLQILKGVPGSLGVIADFALLLRNSNNTVNDLTQIGIGRAAGTYTAVVIGTTLVSSTGFSTEDFFVATRSATTDIAPTERFRITATGRVGLNTTSPSYDLSFGGNAARIMALERHTTADTAGSAFTVEAGGCAFTGTVGNTAGGTLFLKGGQNKGSGGSTIEFYTCAPGGTATADGSQTLRMSINTSGFVNIVALTASKFVKTDASKNLISGDVDWADITNKPATFTPTAHTHNAADVVGGTLAMGTDSWILLQGSVTTVALLAFRVAADANYRFLVGTDGQLEWGAGAAARDVRLWRSAAGNIRTDGNLTIDGLTASKFVKTDSTKKLISADVDWADIINKPSTFTPAAHTHDTADITTGILGSARGGTGNGFAKISGPAASEKTFTLPNESLSILTADSGTGTKTVSTVGSQTVTLHSFTLASGKTCLIIAEVVAHRDDHAASVAYVRRAVFRNNAGTVTQIGSTTDEYTNEDASETALDVLVNFSGTTIQVQVVGRTSANLQWRGNIRVAIA